MDLSMPGMDGVEATRRIVAADDDVRVVVLTSFGEEQRITDALNAGAHGYLLKHIDPDDLLAAIRAAHAGDVPLDPRPVGCCSSSSAGQGSADELTPREEEVLRLVGQGLANKQIARRLGIGERTVKAHLTQRVPAARRQRPCPGGAVGTRTPAGAAETRLTRRPAGRTGSRPGGRRAHRCAHSSSCVPAR